MVTEKWVHFQQGKMRKNTRICKVYCDFKDSIFKNWMSMYLWVFMCRCMKLPMDAWWGIRLFGCEISCDCEPSSMVLGSRFHSSAREANALHCWESSSGYVLQLQITMLQICKLKLVNIGKSNLGKIQAQP